jgi:hypothetical protein
MNRMLSQVTLAQEAPLVFNYCAVTAGNLHYAPPPEEYQERMGDVLASYLASLCTLTRLYGDEELLEVSKQAGMYHNMQISCQPMILCITLCVMSMHVVLCACMG